MTFESRRGRILPPDLDDRTWQDLVDQMRALIPRYAPQWTDHNPSDLGITLIELFAWLAEGVIYRLNQTPDKNYVAFLNLLGITRNPATPARTHLTFTAKAGPVVVAVGTQAQTTALEGRTPVVFETDEDVRVLPTTLTAALAAGPHPAGAASSRYDVVTATLVGPPAGKYLVEVPPGQATQLCLGFDRQVAEEITLGLRLYLPVPEQAQATLTWTYSRGTAEPLAWPSINGVADATGGLRRDGRVRLTPPGDWTPQRAAGPAATKPWTTVTPRDGAAAVTDPLFWIGLRIANPAATPLAIGVDRLLFNAAAARTALTVRAPEPLGQSTGEAFQVFPLRYRPLLRRLGTGAPYADLKVQVGTGDPAVWQDWTLVEDFPPGPGTVYRADPVTGEISFGNHDDRSEQGRQGHGSVPPAGSLIRALSYRYVDAGAAGNVAPAQVTVLGTTLSGILPTGVTNVTNLGPGRDGADEEPIEDTLRRAPEELKIRDRAVTVDDYEFLAGEAGNDVLIRRCLPPRLQAADGPGPAPLPWVKGDPWTFAGIVRAPGTVNMIIVPDQDATVARPEPTQDQIRQVRAYLDPRRDLTARLEVLGPRYLPVIVNVELVVWQQAIDAGADQDKVRSDTLARIQAFLHPTRGGPAGTGWQVGQPVFTSDLFRAIMPSGDLGYISTLQLRPDVPAYHFPPLNPAGTADNYNQDRERPFRLSPFGASVRVADYELVCAAAENSHKITTTVLNA
ncbi:putative baseplate assembly protein [Sphaerisporangium perillae]|uniref:putative baseplate assembly protein n=1 Tax=Sphaerisporangium perillae TaxID=2935860 RepID=UPI00200FFE1B|nr:putative baseplate assembly protein [Sphaerisporangium perillae]